jgi:hypothetical protein
LLSALLMMRRLATALRVALREEDFARVLSAGALLIVIGTTSYSLGARLEPRGQPLRGGRHPDDVECPRSEAHDHRSLAEIFTAGYVLTGIGILVEAARRLGMGFIAARAELEEAKARRVGAGDTRG